MTYAHPQLITAHAPLIGAPHHDQNADLKRLALLKSLSGGVAPGRVGGVATTPTASVPSNGGRPKKTNNSRPDWSSGRVGRKGIGDMTGTVNADVALYLSGISDSPFSSMKDEFYGNNRPYALPRGSVGGVGGDDYKVTGTDRVSQPDKDSQWDPGNGGRWIRKWLPGEKEAEALSRVLSVKDDFANIASERELKGKITLDDLRTQNAIGQYIQQKRADVASNPNIEILKGQLENARNTLFKSVAEKARGVPVSQAGGQSAGTDISAAIIPPQDQHQPSVDGQPLDYGAMFENGGRLFGQDGAVNNGNDGGDSSSFDSLYDQW